jgi:hypothetical protein
MATNKIKQQSADELARIAKVSMDIRQAVRKAIPANTEQFFTLMIPGKVVNFDVSVWSPPPKMVPNRHHP